MSEIFEWLRKLERLFFKFFAIFVLLDMTMSANLPQLLQLWKLNLKSIWNSKFSALVALLDIFCTSEVFQITYECYKTLNKE